MNILLLFSHFNTLEQAGSLRSWQTARFLTKQGHNVTAFAPGVDQRSEELLPEMHGKLFAEYDIEGVRLIRSYTLSKFRHSAKRRLAYDVVYAVLVFLRALIIRSLDIVVVSYPPNVMPAFAYLLAKIRRVPLILEMRDLVSDNLKASNYVKSSRFVTVVKRFERFTVNHSDHVIVVSNGMKKVLVSRNFNEVKISVVPLGYEPEAFEAAEYAWNPRDEFGWWDRFVVIFVGTLNLGSDIPTLLKSAERLQQHKDILFAIVGEGEMRSEYQKYCATRGLTNCQFIDYQPRRKIPVILSAANVAVLLLPDDPAWVCILSNKTFDYLGSKLPMIYAGRGDAAELIQEAQAGIVVPPEDDRSFAEAILRLKGNPAEAKAMGERGHSFVLSNYYMPNLLSDFEEILIRSATKGGVNNATTETTHPVVQDPGGPDV